MKSIEFYLTLLKNEASVIKDSLNPNEYTFKFDYKVYNKGGGFLYFIVTYNKVNCKYDIEYKKIIIESNFMNELINVLCIFEQIKEKHNL